MSKKLILDCDDKLWNQVLKFKIDSGSENNNAAVNRLIKRGLRKN